MDIRESPRIFHQNRHEIRPFDMYEFSETPRHSDEKREKTKLMSLDEFSHILRQERCKRV